MGNQEKLKDLQQKKNMICAGGGNGKIDKQHQSGKLTARERINLLMDPDSFIELDAFVKHRCTEFDMPTTEAPGEGVVTGYGTINGRLTYVFAQDFTVIGGSLGEMHAKKICKVMDMALKMGAPLIGMNDSGGARIQEGIDALSGFGEIFYRNTISSGVIPQISIIMGPCAGGAVYSPAITDFVFMVDQTSQMFITGPQVIKAVTGETVSAEELGGAYSHNSKSGVAHFVNPGDEETITQVRALLSYLPSNNLESAPVYYCDDAAGRICSNLDSLLPEDANKAYDMKDIIAEIVDQHDYMEIQPHFAQNMITALARMNGSTIGIIANQPKYMAGALDVNSSDKAARFVRFCDCFNIPILTLTDVPGYLPGVSQEHSGIIRHGAKLLFAFSEATVPKINVIIRKAYGGAYIAMNSKHLGADMVMAWPSAEIAVMGAEGAANIIFRKEISDSQDPAATRKEVIQDYRDRFYTPYVAAERGYVDDVIEPSLTRQRIINALYMTASKRESRPSKKHGNIPL